MTNQIFDQDFRERKGKNAITQLSNLPLTIWGSEYVMMNRQPLKVIEKT